MPSKMIPPPLISCLIRFVHVGALLQRSSTHTGRTSHAFTWAQTISSPAYITGQTSSDRLALLPQGIVVEPYPVRVLAADCPFYRRLGSRHAPSMRFFPLSPPSRLGVFHPCVVVRTALGDSSNSVCIHMDFHHMLHGDYSTVEGI